jgi:hypothetical protein
MKYNITALFFCIDDFCKSFEEWEKHRLIDTGKKRHRSCEMTLSELLTIMVLYHLSPCKNFKYFYEFHVSHFHKQDFPNLLSYSRFIQLMPRLFIPLCLLLQSLFGEETGTYIADATSLPVCHNKRINRNRVFKGLAARGKTTMGWFYGLKLHMVTNHKGSIVAVKITPGNVDERTVLDELTRHLKGSLYADKVYISQPLFKTLYQRGLKLITGIKRNMKNYLMPMIEKIMLRKRFLIETIFDVLKIHMNLSHTRHRSPTNACVNILACLTAYQFKENKPSMKFYSNALIQS